jgi:NifU-like protein involved in Fe-S cluster formation
VWAGIHAEEVHMRRWLALSVGALVVAALFGHSSVTLQAANKTVSGTVTAVSGDSLTLKVKDAEMKLVVDAKTKVIGKGVGTKAEKMKEEEKKGPTITDLVKTGDGVQVTYDEATKHASEVRLSKPTAPAK